MLDQCFMKVVFRLSPIEFSDLQDITIGPLYFLVNLSLDKVVTCAWVTIVLRATILCS